MGLNLLEEKNEKVCNRCIESEHKIKQVAKGKVLRIPKSCKIAKLNNRMGFEKKGDFFDDIIGNSKSIQQAISIAKKIAKTQFRVLLSGESGTGKELFARAIHQSYRPDGPFIAVNCASIPKSLIESDLFGYEGGAFTGAEKNGRPGKFELAHGGTIFLDEIGDMPIDLQPVLLRVLEEKKIMRVGSVKNIPVDVRVIAATHQDIYQLMKENKFRKDLYFRLSVFKIEIPPLRNRYRDTLLLACHYIKKISDKDGIKILKLSEEASEIILRYSWPGNVRQLENSMIYATYMAKGGVIKARDLPNEILCESNTIINGGTLSERERQIIEETLINTEFKVLEAAKTLGISPSTLYRKLNEYELKIQKQ